MSTSMHHVQPSIQPSFHTFAYGSFATWAPCYSLEETIRRLAKIGYPAVEIGAVRPHAWPWDLDDKDRARLRQLLEDRQMQVSAICPNSQNYNLASSIENERKDGLAYYQACIHLAADLGAPVVVTVPGWRVFGVSYRQAWDWSCQAISELAKTAAKRQVTLAVEPICSAMVNLINRTAQAVELVHAVGEPEVKVMLDTAHLMLEHENPIDAVVEAGDLLVHIHAQDSDGRSLSRRPPGRGDFHWTGFLQALRQSRYQGYLSAEIFGTDADKIASDALHGLQQIIASSAPD